MSTSLAIQQQEERPSHRQLVARACALQPLNVGKKSDPHA
jgi:hypothetical protein